MESLLVVSGDSPFLERACHYFGAQGFHIDAAPDATGALKRLAQRVFDVVIFDIDAVSSALVQLIASIRATSRDAVIIAMFARDGMDMAIRAIREGATDFIQKPVNLAELDIKVDKGVELKRLAHEGQVLRGERNLIHHTRSFIGQSPAIQSVLALVERVAASSSSVILTGETGTGKELLAGALHYNSSRAGHAFVRVNCATLPDTLLESELFGHEKGAFTGAEKQRIGRFEQGNGGTVFLDEIADVSPSTQAKLLRVLQEHEFERLGSNRTIRVDVRVISATNKDLATEIEAGRFRQDLFYRLNVVTIAIPALREREGDIDLLSAYFLRKYAHRLNKKVRRIEPSALRMLRTYHWPGNVRELENTIERAVLMADSDIVTEDDLSLPFKTGPSRARGIVRIPPGGLVWQDVERELIVQALEMSGWIQKRAAALLGLSTRVLNYKIKQFEIRHASWKQNR